MHSRLRHKLHFGPYRTPRFKLGAKVKDELRGEVTIVRVSDGRIPWPVAKRGRGRLSLVLYADLAKAVQKESNATVAHWWGVSGQTVTKWRKCFRVPLSNAGTHRLRSALSRMPQVQAGLRKAQAKARDPIRRAKIAAAKVGKARPPHVLAILRNATLGRKLSMKSRRRMSEAQRRRGVRPPAAGRAWTPDEDALLGNMPAKEVAQRTGRTLAAVYCRRQDLGLIDGRTRKHSN